MNFEQARFNMIEQQLRPWEVLDEGTLELLSRVKREEFAPPAWRNLAYADIEVPLGHGAAMLAPKVEARALQAVGLRKQDTVLEIGAGSGYFAALLAVRAEQVWTIEIVPALAEMARANLRRQSIANVAVAIGDGARGWTAQAPYDVIMVSGSLPAVPDVMRAQLKIGGRLFAIVGAAPAMTARLIVRETASAFRSVGLFETAATPLKNVWQPARALI